MASPPHINIDDVRRRHITGSSTTSNRRSEEIFLDNLGRWVRGDTLRNAAP